MAGFPGQYQGPINSMPSNPSVAIPPQRNGRKPSDIDRYANPHQEQAWPEHAKPGKNKKGNDMAIHRPRINRKTSTDVKSSSGLTTKFDPMKDRHMWAMWRTAVNGRIVDQVRRNEQIKQDGVVPDDIAFGNEPPVYGKDLMVPPLSRFIRLNQRSKDIANELMNEGQGKLETAQFIYYGLPRVTANVNNSNNNNNNRQLNGGYQTNNYNNVNTYNGHVNGTAHPDPTNNYQERRS